MKLINELNEREADLGVNESVSWHSEYRDSAWIFVGEGRSTDQRGVQQMLRESGTLTFVLILQEAFPTSSQRGT